MPYKKSGRIVKSINLFLLIITFTVIFGVVGVFAQSSKMIQGKDYVVLERIRILDEMGFDRPVEAMSILVPKGWQTQSNVRWNSISGCRGEIITWELSVTSPDGAIRLVVLPTRSFVYSQDQRMQQTFIAEAQQGGCKVSSPFNAQQYLENLARNGLGAKVSNILTDEVVQAAIDRFNANANAIARQSGTGMSYYGSIVYGTLNWSDGTKGLARIGVSNSVNQSLGAYTGTSSGTASTMVNSPVFIRYSPEREAEALKVFGTVNSSFRANPVWLQARENFLTQLGNAEHAQRMERIRLMGEQSRAYAKAQSDASNARMRDWERSQASSDASHKSYIQTIREVETWKDGSGNAVELGSGYNYGWSKPDGSYILTNNSLFNPAVELKENWVKMQKAPQ